MKARNANRPGYKKTEVGWIPQEWRCAPAGNLFDIQLGKMLSRKARDGRNPQPYLANYNVRWGQFDLSEVQQMDFYEKELYKFQLQQGDLLVCEGGEVGRCAVWEEQIKPCYFQKALHRVRASDGNIDVYFVMYFLQHAVSSPLMANFVGQSSISHFTREQFIKFPIALPPLGEQEKIAEILLTWDTAIDQTRRLITAKQNRQKALMQQLLMGKKRLPGFDPAKGSCRKRPQDWRSLRAKEIFQTRSAKNCANEPVLSVTQDDGVVFRETLDRKIENPSTSLSAYKLVEPGDFVISLRSFQGGLEHSDLKGIVSPAYHVIRPVRDIDATYYKYLFKSRDFIDRLASAVMGIRDGKQVNYNDFSFLCLPYPPAEEQKAIGKVLLAADNEVAVVEKQLGRLEKQKRGLMQKLLTGEVRVKA